MSNQFLSVPIVQAVAIGNLKQSGRSKPLDIFCETDEGLTTYTVKLYGNLELGFHQLAREIYGSLLATYFSIATPDISKVNIPENFLADQPNGEIKSMIHRSPGLNFGSKTITGAIIYQPSIQ